MCIRSCEPSISTTRSLLSTRSSTIHDSVACRCRRHTAVPFGNVYNALRSMVVRCCSVPAPLWPANLICASRLSNQADVRCLELKYKANRFEDRLAMVKLTAMHVPSIIHIDVIALHDRNQRLCLCRHKLPHSKAVGLLPSCTTDKTKVSLEHYLT